MHIYEYMQINANKCIYDDMMICLVFVRIVFWIQIYSDIRSYQNFISGTPSWINIEDFKVKGATPEKNCKNGYLFAICLAIR